MKDKMKMKSSLMVFFSFACILAYAENSVALDLFKKKALKCGDPDVINTVTDILKKNWLPYKKGKITMDFIRATGFDKEIGRYSCAAVANKGKDSELRISYTVSLDAENEDGGYIVEVESEE